MIRLGKQARYLWKVIIQKSFIFCVQVNILLYNMKTCNEVIKNIGYMYNPEK